MEIEKKSIAVGVLIPGEVPNTISGVSAERLGWGGGVRNTSFAEHLTADHLWGTKFKITKAC